MNSRFYENLIILQAFKLISIEVSFHFAAGALAGGGGVLFKGKELSKIRINRLPMADFRCLLDRAKTHSSLSYCSIVFWCIILKLVTTLTGDGIQV